MENIDLVRCVEVSKRIALKAGEVMLKYFGRVEAADKGGKQIVTDADLEINEMVIREVGDIYPGHSIFGEEGSLMKMSEYVWVCDPLDGTIPYSRSIPVSVFSLALVHDGKPLTGVVYDPFMKRMYNAITGGGAFLNEKRISVNENVLDWRAVVDAEWWSDAEYDVDACMRLLEKDTEAFVMQIGSTIQAGCLVASGRIEACVFAGTKGKNVDTAALKVIVEEAGGVVTDLRGHDQRYDGDICGAIISNKVAFDKILEYTSKIE